MRRCAVLAVCCLLFSASPVHADFYKWTDKDGNESYTNDPKQIPREYEGRATVVRPDERRVTVGDEAVAPGSVVVTGQEHKDKYGHGEEYWRRRAANLRLKLRDKQDEHDLVLRQMEDEDRKAKKTGGRKRKSGLKNKKMRLEKQIAAITRELEIELPEEARKAGAYPGWIRE